MPPRSRLILGAGVAASLVLVACSRPAASSATSAAAREAGSASTQQIVLNARDIAFAPNAMSLRAGEPARLVFVNDGQVEHDVTIPGITGDGKTTEGHGHEPAGHTMGQLEPGTIHVSAHAGDRATIEFTPRAGTYEYICTLPGHKEAGMRGTLTVK